MKKTIRGNAGKQFRRLCLLSLAVVLTASLARAEYPSPQDLSPVRITLNGNGELLVTDYVYGQVLTVDPDTLDITGEIDVNGKPLGIAWADNLYYVGNSSTGQVEVYNAAGHELFALGYGEVSIEMPQDIALADTNVYVVDGADKNVKIFSRDGIFVGTIPAGGQDANLLANPTAITVDETNRQIFVSDFGDLGSTPLIAPRIQVFNYAGDLLRTIQSGSANNYRFTMPQGLSVNDDNELFVVDSLTGDVLMFDTVEGTLLGKVKGTGIDAGPLAMILPLDVVIGNGRNAYVTNNLMASIKTIEGAGGI